VSARSTAEGVVQLTSEHESGCLGQLLISDRVGVAAALVDVGVYGTEGYESFSTSGLDYSSVWPEVRREFASAVVRGTRPTVDADGGLQVQRIIDAAARALVQDRSVDVS
jgi:predicted dehydrogenase